MANGKASEDGEVKCEAACSGAGARVTNACSEQPLQKASVGVAAEGSEASGSVGEEAFDPSDAASAEGTEEEEAEEEESVVSGDDGGASAASVSPRALAGSALRAVTGGIGAFQVYQRFRVRMVQIFGSLASALYEFGAGSVAGRVSRRGHGHGQRHSNNNFYLRDLKKYMLTLQSFQVFDCVTTYI